MGLLYRVGSFRPLSYRDLGNFALKGAIMEVKDLKNSITTLQKLRDAHHSQLDTCVLLELDEVIAELKKLSDNKQSNIKLGTLSMKALLLISQILQVISNITDLMK
jgi:hypothetical protein